MGNGCFGRQREGKNRSSSLLTLLVSCLGSLLSCPIFTVLSAIELELFHYDHFINASRPPLQLMLSRRLRFLGHFTLSDNLRFRGIVEMFWRAIKSRLFGIEKYQIFCLLSFFVRSRRSLSLGNTEDERRRKRLSQRRTMAKEP